MRKAVLASIVAAAFFAGTFFTAFSIADATNGDNAWAKLVARVLALEQKVIKVTLQDDENGHAKGWNPDGTSQPFLITDLNVHADSIVEISIGQTAGEDTFGTDGSTFCNVFTLEGEFAFSCDPSGVGMPEGAFLSYVVIN
jgi:hypothetical protein